MCGSETLLQTMLINESKEMYPNNISLCPHVYSTLIVCLFLIKLNFVKPYSLILFIRVLMASWLPTAYDLNQMAIIVLGLWAIVHRESVIQVELVCLISSRTFVVKRMKNKNSTRPCNLIFFFVQLMLIKAFSIILDAIAIGMYFQFGKTSKFVFFLFSILISNIYFKVYQAMDRTSYFAFSAL